MLSSWKNDYVPYLKTFLLSGPPMFSIDVLGSMPRPSQRNHKVLTVLAAIIALGDKVMLGGDFISTCWVAIFRGNQGLTRNCIWLVAFSGYISWNAHQHQTTGKSTWLEFHSNFVFQASPQNRPGQGLNPIPIYWHGAAGSPTLSLRLAEPSDRIHLQSPWRKSVVSSSA